MKENDLIYWQDDRGIIRSYHVKDYEKKTGTGRSTDEDILRNPTGYTVANPVPELPTDIQTGSCPHRETADDENTTGREKTPSLTKSI